MVEGIRVLIDGFNDSCKNIAASYMKVRDESMSIIRFCTTQKGNYLTCPIFSASQSHWGQSSRKLHVLLQGTCYFLKYIE